MQNLTKRVNHALELSKPAGTAACEFFVGLRSPTQAPRRFHPCRFCFAGAAAGGLCSSAARYAGGDCGERRVWLAKWPFIKDQTAYFAAGAKKGLWMKEYFKSRQGAKRLCQGSG
jgi:hypothetical protein